MLQLKNLSVRVGKKKILHNINFDFERGKLYAIMGPNGSGKTTLAASVMGHPALKIDTKSQIFFEGKNIKKLKTYERAKRGLFMSFQSPLSLSGVNVYQLLRYGLDSQMDPMKVREKVESYAKELNIGEELLSRSLNAEFSGGEKKKMEILQAAMLDPKLAFFDEVDTGVDVDAIGTISKFLNRMNRKDRTLILITHYNRILKYLKPDRVLVLIDGKLIKTGGSKLADMIEKKGYDIVNSSLN